MKIRVVCVFASSSCIGTEPAASVTENVESENTDFRAVISRITTALHEFCVVALSKHTYVTGMTQGFQNCAQIRFKIRITENNRFLSLEEIQIQNFASEFFYREPKI